MTINDMSRNYSVLSRSRTIGDAVLPSGLQGQLGAAPKIPNSFLGSIAIRLDDAVVRLPLETELVMLRAMALLSVTGSFAPTETCLCDAEV